MQFQEVDHAVAFMKENFPKLFVQLNHTTDDVPEGKFDAFIHYARSRENRDELVARMADSNDWTCPSVGVSSPATFQSTNVSSVTSPTMQVEQSARFAVDPKLVS